MPITAMTRDDHQSTSVRRGGDVTQVSEMVDGDSEIHSQEDLDMARDYWLSEHHRFEYSQYSEVLLELDPVSYHSVGLAMPGSFISKRKKYFRTFVC